MEHSLIQLVSYNLWANEKMAETLRPVGDAIIHAEMKSSFASISKTLHHLADAQVVWLKRLKGEPLNVPSGNFNGSKEELFRKLLGSSEELVQLMRSRGDDFLKSKIFYTNLKGDRSYEDTVETVIHQIVIHGSYHRGQVTTMLREAGVQSINGMDFLLYQRQRQGVE